MVGGAAVLPRFVLCMGEQDQVMAGGRMQSMVRSMTRTDLELRKDVCVDEVVVARYSRTMTPFTWVAN